MTATLTLIMSIGRHYHQAKLAIGNTIRASKITHARQLPEASFAERYLGRAAGRQLGSDGMETLASMVVSTR